MFDDDDAFTSLAVSISHHNINKKLLSAPLSWEPCYCGQTLTPVLSVVHHTSTLEEFSLSVTAVSGCLWRYSPSPLLLWWQAQCMNPAPPEHTNTIQKSVPGLINIVSQNCIRQNASSCHTASSPYIFLFFVKYM